VIVQSEAILTNSSDYWISVINAGRAFSLNDIRAVDETSTEAGQTITSLMHVADVLSTCPAPQAATPSCICTTAAQAALHGLACTYLKRPELVAAGLLPPKLLDVPAASLSLKAEVALSLKALVESGSGAAPSVGTVPEDPDAELYLFDAQLDVQRKMKKAFCEPGNVNHCPPIAVFEQVVLPYSAERQLVVKRKEENGGDLSFTSAEQLVATYASGELHPGDLKPAVRDAVDAVLQRVRSCVQADSELSKAEKEVQKVVKRKKK